MYKDVQKSWGVMRKIFDDPYSSVWEIEVMQNGKCSKHYHEYKTNQFILIEGILQIEVWWNGPEAKPSVIILDSSKGTQQSLMVPSRIYHRFTGLTFVRANESYWNIDGDKISDDDIVRMTS